MEDDGIKLDSLFKMSLIADIVNVRQKTYLFDKNSITQHVLQMLTHEPGAVELFRVIIQRKLRHTFFLQLNAVVVDKRVANLWQVVN